MTRFNACGGSSGGGTLLKSGLRLAPTELVGLVWLPLKQKAPPFRAG